MLSRKLVFVLPWYHGGFKSKHICDRGAALGDLEDVSWLFSGPLTSLLEHIKAWVFVGTDICFLLALCSSFVLIVVVVRGGGGG